MSYEYDQYLEKHITNVTNGYNWIQENLPELFDEIKVNPNQFNGKMHDFSKRYPELYNPYDAYFYGNERSEEVIQKFKYAWLVHIHNDLHHWQHWVLINDQPEEGIVALDMPNNYILEMICDWWSFSWSKGKLDEIFAWYGSHRDYMVLSEKTRDTVEYILSKIKAKLEEKANAEN